jgi:hypothetical protein
VKLMNDKFGNYVIQKCVDCLSKIEQVEKNGIKVKELFLERIVKL